MFALHAGIAIERVRLHAQIQRLALIDERERIGKDLHDGIIQVIYAVALSLEDLPDLRVEDRDEATARVGRAIDRLNLVIRDIRNFILGLGPELALNVGLLAGLASLVEEVRLNSVIDVELDLADAEVVTAAIPDETIAQLLQMAREALSNVALHSSASRGVVSLRSAADLAVFEVSDNGRGFDPETVHAAGHLGLANLANRAAAGGGTLTVESALDAGTRIIVRLPLGTSETATP